MSLDEPDRRRAGVAGRVARRRGQVARAEPAGGRRAVRPLGRSGGGAGRAARAAGQARRWRVVGRGRRSGVGDAGQVPGADDHRPPGGGRRDAVDQLQVRVDPRNARGASASRRFSQGATGRRRRCRRQLLGFVDRLLAGSRSRLGSLPVSAAGSRQGLVGSSFDTVAGLVDGVDRPLDERRTEDHGHRHAQMLTMILIFFAFFFLTRALGGTERGLARPHLLRHQVRHRMTRLAAVCFAGGSAGGAGGSAPRRAVSAASAPSRRSAPATRLAASVRCRRW